MLTIFQVIQSAIMFMLGTVAIWLFWIIRKVGQNAISKIKKLKEENRQLRIKISLAKTFIENHHEKTDLRNNIIKRLTLKNEG